VTVCASVLSDGIEIADLTAPDGEPAVWLNVSNLGNLPAIGWGVMHEFIIKRPGASILIDPPPYIAPVGRTNLIGPNRTLRAPFTVWSADGSLREQIAGILDGSLEGTLWLIARYTYTDRNETEGDASYCWYYTAWGGNPRFMDFFMPGFGIPDRPEK
jgi:hypothetical protein